MAFYSKNALREELLLKEGKLDHEKKLIQANLQHIREKKKEIEDALKKVDSISVLGESDVPPIPEIDDLIKYSKRSDHGMGNQIMLFLAGFIGTVLLLVLLGL